LDAIYELSTYIGTIDKAIYCAVTLFPPSA
jgi:hypothetical protein